MIVWNHWKIATFHCFSRSKTKTFSLLARHRDQYFQNIIIVANTITTGKKKFLEKSALSWGKRFSFFEHFPWSYRCYFLVLVTKEKQVTFSPLACKKSIIFSTNVLILGLPSLVFEKDFQMMLRLLPQLLQQHPFIEIIEYFSRTIL